MPRFRLISAMTPLIVLATLLAACGQLAHLSMLADHAK